MRVGGLSTQSSIKFLAICLLSFLHLQVAFFAPRVAGHTQNCGGFFSKLSLPWKACRSTGDDLISKELSSNDMTHVRILSQVFGKPSLVPSLTGTNDEIDIFSSLFRHCAPYIANHRGSTIVVHIPGHVLRTRSIFSAIMDDISMLHLLGIRIVLVVGVREQLDTRIMENGDHVTYHAGMRVTDDKSLRILKEESGTARFEVESALSKGFRGMTGQSGINVVSGNLFYSAKPLGVRDGIDFQYTGEVRRIEVDNFRRRLDSGDIVLLTSLGYSTSGEVFHVPSESLAAECAAKLKAAKIIYLTEGEGLIDLRNHKAIQSLRLSQASSLLDLWGIPKSAYNYVEEDESTLDLARRNLERDLIEPKAMNTDLNSTSLDSASSICRSGEMCDPTAVAAYIRLLARCVFALTGGVKRAHLVCAQGGTLLRELFTRDGAGMLISRDVYEGMRPASEADLPAILEIIQPLEQEGILIHRTREALRQELRHCFVMTRDSSILGCGMLKPFNSTHAEIACLAVHPRFRREGRGELLLAYLERRAVLMGLTHLFALSTRTMQWFEERGFQPSDPSVLPSNRLYDKERGSKVYMKTLGSQRDVEAEELLWDIS